MDPQDDPEARIRELEQPLSDAARTSELGAARTSELGAARTSELGRAQDASTYGYIPSTPDVPAPPPGVYPSPPTVPYPAPGDVTFHTTPMPARSPQAAFVVPIVIAVLGVLFAGGVTLYLMSKPDPPTVFGGGTTWSRRRAAPCRGRAPRSGYPA